MTSRDHVFHRSFRGVANPVAVCNRQGPALAGACPHMREAWHSFSYHWDTLRHFLRCILVFALVQTLAYYAPLWRSRKVRQWPAIPAEIVARNIVVLPPRNSRTPDETLSAVLVLRYEFDSITYEREAWVQDIPKHRLSYFRNSPSLIARIPPNNPQVPTILMQDQATRWPRGSGEPLRSPRGPHPRSRGETGGPLPLPQPAA